MTIVQITHIYVFTVFTLTIAGVPLMYLKSPNKNEPKIKGLGRIAIPALLLFILPAFAGGVIAMAGGSGLYLAVMPFYASTISCLFLWGIAVKMFNQKNKEKKRMTKMDNSLRCVVDAEGHYVTLISMYDPQGIKLDAPYEYKMKEGERLIETMIPKGRPYAGMEGLIRPRWDGAEWVEDATPEEIERWEGEHPAPEPPGPSLYERVESVEAQVTDAQLALVDVYEQADKQGTDVMLALTEVYEAVIGAGEGGEMANG